MQAGSFCPVNPKCRGMVRSPCCAGPSWMARSSEHPAHGGPYCSEGLAVGVMGQTLLTSTITSSPDVADCGLNGHAGDQVRGDVGQLTSILSASVFLFLLEPSLSCWLPGIDDHVCRCAIPCLQGVTCCLHTC